MRNFIVPFLVLTIVSFSSTKLIANKKTPISSPEIARILPFDKDTTPTILIVNIPTIIKAKDVRYLNSVNAIPSIVLKKNAPIIFAKKTLPINSIKNIPTINIKNIPTINKAPNAPMIKNKEVSTKVSSFSYDYEGIAPKIAPSTNEDVKLMPIEGEIDDESILNLEVEESSEIAPNE